MKLEIKQYEYVKKEIEKKNIEIPEAISYYFETGIRRSIRITPKFTTWNKKNYDKDEELYKLEFLCLYQSSEFKIEKFTINVKDLEKIYYSEKHEHKGIITSLINGWFDKRTKEKFEEDLNVMLTELNIE